MENEGCISEARRRLNEQHFIELENEESLSKEIEQLHE
jgi:hypothetical protein